MEQLLEDLNKLAEELKSNDPDRYATKVEEIDYEELIETIEEKKITETEWVPLSKNEKNEKARILYDNQIPMPGQKIPILEKINVPITRDVIEYETRFHEYKTGIFFKDTHSIPYQVMKSKQITDNYETTKIVGWKDEKPMKLPQSFFVASLTGQMKPQQVEKIVPVKVINKRPAKRRIEVGYEKHSPEHYQKLAAEEIKKRLVSSIRRQNNPQGLNRLERK
ncbi:hypothetical protein SteCoe_30576 [Stentor coeruleus]|uniref:Uncharacterized protein n=1 Tax=Stentor coeruleus TaxID=5963 RepID=A0A1R2B3B2_9CILI|nr:hypothetical protein SteCoe_30576 [Stentor coeruleus]